MKIPVVPIAVAVVLLLAACAPAGTSTTSTAPTPATTVAANPAHTATSDNETPASHPMGTDDPQMSSSPSQAPAPDPSATGVSFEQPWAVALLIDVSTGEQFRLADLAAEGKVVFVETMATWCSYCRTQQSEAATAFEGLDPARVAWVVLDIEANEDAEALARYRDQNGFPFQYAIADQDLARALATEFGDVVLSPPSVNVIIMGRDGQVTHTLGNHRAAEIQVLAAEHGA